MTDKQNNYIRVKVKSGCRPETITVLADGRLLIRVKPKSEKGLANQRVLELVAEYFKADKVVIIRGHQSPSKLLKIF